MPLWLQRPWGQPTCARLARPPSLQLHAAFSRERSQKEYVQHQMEAHAAEVWAALSDSGAGRWPGWVQLAGWLAWACRLAGLLVGRQGGSPPREQAACHALHAGVSALAHPPAHMHMWLQRAATSMCVAMPRTWPRMCTTRCTPSLPRCGASRCAGMLAPWRVALDGACRGVAHAGVLLQPTACDWHPSPLRWLCRPRAARMPRRR